MTRANIFHIARIVLLAVNDLV